MINRKLGDIMERKELIEKELEFVEDWSNMIVTPKDLMLVNLRQLIREHLNYAKDISSTESVIDSQEIPCGQESDRKELRVPSPDNIHSQIKKELDGDYGWICDCGFWNCNNGNYKILKCQKCGRKYAKDKLNETRDKDVK